MATKAEIVITAKDKTKRAFRGVEKGLNRMKSAVFNTRLAVAGLAGVVGLGLLTKSAINSADEIQKLSIKLGASTEALSEYRHVAELSGVEFKTLTKGFQNMADKISDFANGMGEAKASLEELGFVAEDLNKLKPEEQFEAIADAMQGVALQGDKVRIAMDIFGGRGVGLLQAMEGGAAGIRKMREEAERLGITLSQTDADGAAAANDAMTRLAATAKALKITLGRELQGPIEQIADKLTEAALASGGFQTEIRSAIKGGLKALVTMVEATDSVLTFFETREGLATAGIVGFILFGKKGVAAIFAAQLIVDATAAAIVSMSNIPGGEGIAAFADPAKLDKARENLIFLQDTFDRFHRMRMSLRQVEESANEISARLAIETQERRITGMETMLDFQGELNDKQEKSVGLLAGTVIVLNEMIDAMDQIREATETGILAGEETDEATETRRKIRAGFVELEQKFQDQLTDIYLKGLSERQKFELLSSKERTKKVLGDMIAMTQGVALHNKAMFKINKIASIANAIISGHAAFNKTMEVYPYPLNIALASLGAVATVAQIQAIKSTSFSGGDSGTTPSAAGSVPSINDTPILPSPDTVQPTTEVNLTINGGFHSSEAVRELIEAINDEIGDGVQLNVTVAA